MDTVLSALLLVSQRSLVASWTEIAGLGATSMVVVDGDVAGDAGSEFVNRLLMLDDG